MLELTLLSKDTPAELTVRETEAVWLRAPLTPVIVRLNVPFVVVAVVVIDRVEVEVAGLGLKVPVAPAGSPVTFNVTWPANPSSGVTATV